MVLWDLQCPIASADASALHCALLCLAILLSVKRSFAQVYCTVLEATQANDHVLQNAHDKWARQCLLIRLLELAGTAVITAVSYQQCVHNWHVCSGMLIGMCLPPSIRNKLI